MSELKEKYMINRVLKKVEDLRNRMLKVGHLIGMFKDEIVCQETLNKLEESYEFLTTYEENLRGYL